MKSSTNISIVTLLIVGFSTIHCDFPSLEAILNEIQTIDSTYNRDAKKNSLYKWSNYEIDPELDMTTVSVD